MDGLFEDVVDFRAGSLINASRKWGVFLSDHEVNEINKDEQLENFQHKVTDLNIFDNGELNVLNHHHSCRNHLCITSPKLL